MDTKALEKFCPWARVRLIEAVELRCRLFGLDDAGRAAAPAGSDVVAGRVLTAAQKKQRDALLARIDAAEDGYNALVQEAAYTWFNRYIAIRFMELHGYLSSNVRMLSCAADGSFAPDCLRQAADLALPGLDEAEVLRLMGEGDDEAVFRLVLVAQCNELASALPDVFGHVGEADALLLPDNLLRQGADDVLYHLVADIPEAAWDDVEVLGWMYQFYNAELKADFFNSKRKAAAADIAPATQLFTPEWIVRYMVENSLGRLWMLNHPQSALRERMAYYIEPDAEHEEFLRVSSPEDITFCDPACGSGHILSYAFELLFAMYEEAGYRERDIPELILSKNLAGMEIDERAAQIASLVLALRAREHDRRFFRREVRANVCVLESIPFEEGELVYCSKALTEALTHLGEVGSLLAPTEKDLADLRADLAVCAGDLFASAKAERLKLAIEKCEALSRRFDVVVANPPYMGSAKFNPFMSASVKKHYPDVKSDLCTCFIERGFNLAKEQGYAAMVTMQSWMFLGSFERMRGDIIANKGIVTMAHLGPRAFDAIGGEVVSVTADVIYNGRLSGAGSYVRLVDINGSEEKRLKLVEAIQNPTCGWFYRRDAQTFTQIPGTPIAYWLPKSIGSMFKDGNLGLVFESAGRVKTHNNELYVRNWWEIESAKLHAKWRPYANGGGFCRWSGLRFDVVNWSEEAIENYGSHGGLPNPKALNREGICWGLITSSDTSFRFKTTDELFSSGSPTIVIKQALDASVLIGYLGFLNSSVCKALLQAFNATLNTTVGDVLALPCLPVAWDHNETARVSKACGEIVTADWDSLETSGDFKRHPLL
ncbi:MAG: BREX-1 system adenine-specific DNA-methyltransferase PglX [Coriobacteriia bacterium]|nr:BREX-1 system adenine-specific DNA-methyltransferase PglX [Coriobacteriia bacterium]